MVDRLVKKRKTRSICVERQMNVGDARLLEGEGGTGVRGG